MVDGPWCQQSTDSKAHMQLLLSLHLSLQLKEEWSSFFWYFYGVYYLNSIPIYFRCHGPRVVGLLAQWKKEDWINSMLMIVVLLLLLLLLLEEKKKCRPLSSFTELFLLSLWETHESTVNHSPLEFTVARVATTLGHVDLHREPEMTSSGYADMLTTHSGIIDHGWHYDEYPA